MAKHLRRSLSVLLFISFLATSFGTSYSTAKAAQHTFTTNIPLINEFTGNPAGTDPNPMSFEIVGPVNTAFDLWILSIENDGYNGTVDRASHVTGTFDANGLAVVSIPDFENPSFTVILTDNFTGSTGSTDIDPANDGNLDTSTLGTIYDAVGVSDSSADDAVLYGVTLGGDNVYFNGEYEPLLVFRDGTSGIWYNTVTVDYGQTTEHIGVFDTTGNELNGSDFDNDPTVSNTFNTFGAINPSYNPPGDTPPAVSSTTPTNGATNVAIDSNIDINFSENVTVSGTWYNISCTSSGTHTATVSGGAQNFTLNPNSNFSNNESCTVTVYAAQVADQDGTADNMATDYTFSFSVIPPFTQQILLNEFLADPASDMTGDANGDGTRDSSQDEFVELVNISGADLDISGWTLSDGVGVRHVFPSGTIIPADCTIVVFGGGTPTGSFGNATVQTASSLALGLNNGGDTITVNDGTYDQVNYAYGSEGGDNQSLTLDPDLSGASFVKHSVATGSGGALFSPGTRIDGSLFSGCVVSHCGDTATYIHAIQGNGTVSPEVGNTHTIEGVVVGDFQTDTYLRGFFVQEEDGDKDTDPTTSEGIFVYDGSSPAVDVNLGDLVRVEGTVAEYYDLTELSSVSNVEICSTGNTSSAATVVLPVADVGVWEYYEGMLVNIAQTLYVTGNYNQGRYGEVELSVNARLDNPTNVVSPGSAANLLQALNDRSRIQLEDGSTAQNPIPAPYIGVNNTLRAGDTIPGITGVINYSYGDYELQPVGTVSFTRENTRTPTPTISNSRLKLASFNVLNYFTTLDDGSCPYSGGCRGADTAAEFTRQRDKIIAAITTMDADIIGLMEMENHPTDNALQDLVSGLNAAAGAGTYAYINTGVIGTDVIKVAFIYKTATVTPTGAHAILDSSVDPNFNDDKNRPALAQTFTEIATGEEFTAVVNHLKSKGSDCDALGDPDTGDGQGNCNLTRTSAATALVDWLNTDPTNSGDPDFIIIGDLNSYAKEDPITAIINGGYTDLIARFVTSPYSYVYMGQAGYLDHALANASLSAQVTETEEWHINADEPSALDYNDYNQPSLYNADAYRASDHDPVIIGLTLGTPPTVLYGVHTIPANGASLSTGPTQIFVEFNQEVVSDGGPDAANYVNNYLLVEAGANETFNTLSCAAGVAADDTQITVNAADYETSSHIATLNINNGSALESGNYRLFICGSTSILNPAGYHLNGDLVSGTDSTLDFTVDSASSTTPSSLPDTGFPHGHTAALPEQPTAKAYTATEMTLEIPKLGINTPIVGVPQTDTGWDVTWLGNSAGYLAGSAFPTWTGNTVITGHVWDAFNRPGVFAEIKSLSYGDQVQIHAWGQTYTYEVRESKLVTSKNVNAVLQSEEYDWLTLVTCEFYNPFNGDYLFRRAVRAVLVSVK